MRLPLLLSVLALLMVSCQHGAPAASTGDRATAEKLMANIRPGMTAAQIQGIIPHVGILQSTVVERGGVWYDMTVSNDYIIQFRVARPQGGKSAEQSVINYSPRLRDRRTLAFISGEERSW